MKNGKSIPKFKTEKQEAQYWSTHAVTDFEHELKEVKNVHFPKPAHTVVLRLNEDQWRKLRELALTRKLSYVSILERMISKELSVM